MDLGVYAQLGIAGFAILVMWWMYDSNTKERARHDTEMGAERLRNEERIEKKENAYRLLGEDIRNKVSAQLMESTNAMTEHAQVMKAVVQELARIQREN